MLTKLAKLSRTANIPLDSLLNKQEKAMKYLFCLAFIGLFLGSWLTHIVTCLEDEKWGFLIAGAIMFPIAIIHGVGVWLGIF